MGRARDVAQPCSFLVQVSPGGGRAAAISRRAEAGPPAGARRGRSAAQARNYGHLSMPSLLHVVVLPLLADEFLRTRLLARTTASRSSPHGAREGGLLPAVARSMRPMKAMQACPSRMPCARVIARPAAVPEGQVSCSEHGVNPMYGCLPMVVQIPIFYAFYPTLQYSVGSRRAVLPDHRLPEGSVLCPAHPHAFPGWSSSMTPTVGDPRQAQSAPIMPVVLRSCSSLPQGSCSLAVNNRLSIGQQYLIDRSAVPRRSSSVEACRPEPGARSTSGHPARQDSALFKAPPRRSGQPPCRTHLSPRSPRISRHRRATRRRPHRLPRSCRPVRHPVLSRHAPCRCAGSGLPCSTSAAAPDPGLILKLARLEWEVALVEAARRRANPRTSADARPRGSVHGERAEALTSGGLAGRFRTVTMRAVAAPETAAVLARPFLAAAGVLLLPLGPEGGFPAGQLREVTLTTPGELPWRRQFLIIRRAELDAGQLDHVDLDASGREPVEQALSRTPARGGGRRPEQVAGPRNLWPTPRPAFLRGSRGHSGHLRTASR